MASISESPESLVEDAGSAGLEDAGPADLDAGLEDAAPASLDAGGWRHHDVRWLLAVIGGVAAFALIFSALTVLRHERFMSHAFDMGYMLQASWLFRNFEPAFSTILGLEWGDHTRFPMYVIALAVPVTPWTLLPLQSLVLASGAIPLFLLTRARCPQPVAASLAGLYLLYPSLQWTAWYDYHPEVVATPLILWMLWAYERGAWRWYWVFAVAAMASREDAALAVLLVGVVVLLERQVRHGVATIAAAGAWIGGAFLLLGALNPYTGLVESRYSWLGSNPFEMAFNAVRWTLTGDRVLLGLTLFVLASYYLAAPFAALARPTRLWLPLPLIAAYTLSVSATHKSIYFHYGYLVVPLLFFAASDGLARLWQRPPQLRWAGVAAGSVSVIVGIAFFSPFTPWSWDHEHVYRKPAPLLTQLERTHSGDYLEEARHVVSTIPRGDSVSAPGNIVPHLANRHEVYLMPNPFLTAWFGEYLHTATPDDLGPRIDVDNPPTWVVTDSRGGGVEGPERRTELVGQLPVRYVAVYEGFYLTLWRLRIPDPVADGAAEQQIRPAA